MKVCPVCQRCYDDDVFSCSVENHASLSDGRAGGCEIIPNYRLEILHESSPTTETYRAANVILQKTYLITILAPEAFDENSIKLFQRETQALSAVIHPNVARVFESGTLADGSLYVVTEYLTAQTLRECLDNVGNPSEITALAIARQAAEGLEAVHAAGALHRNIKPENIVLTTDAEGDFTVKLQNIDFGAIRQKQANAVPELYLSDFRYFSPEQCSAKEADAQTDIYSLGVVLYEALAGRAPFNAAYADAIIKKQINETPPEVKINSFDIRMLLTHTLTDALQKQTRLRLKSANAFARQLRHIEQLATHSSTPPPAVAYPATMNKPALEFTPPAKAEKPVAVENKAVVEDLPLIEEETILQEETPIIFEAETVVENEPIAEEIPLLIEKQSVDEELALAEHKPAVEDSPVAVETHPAVEEIPVIFEAEAAVEESLPVIENQIAVENLTLAENEPVVEEIPAANAELFIEEIPKKSPPRLKRLSKKIRKTFDRARSKHEVLPAIKDQAVVETPAEAEAQAVAENPAETENQIIFEAPAETQAIFEETQPAVEELTPIEVESPAVIENPVEVRVAGEETETPVDLTTNKLPPVETVIKKTLPENIRITEITPIFTLKRKADDIHKTSEPVLVEWKQPDDVPTTTQALDAGQKEIADAAFAQSEDFIEDDIIDAGDADAPPVVKGYEYRRSYDEENPLFAYPETGWNLSGNRKVLTGIGLTALLVLVVGGMLLTRQIQSARSAEQTTAKSSPSGKTLSKTTEAERISETENSPAAKPENLLLENPPTTDSPDVQPRETDAKTAVPSAPTRIKKSAVKETPETKTETVSKEISGKKADAERAPDKKPEVKNQTPTSAKTDGLTRPRIVKTP